MLVYKIDVLQALKERGFNTGRLRKERLLAESTIQKLRHGEPVAWLNIDQVCGLLQVQPGDLLAYVPEDQTDEAAG